MTCWSSGEYPVFCSFCSSNSHANPQWPECYLTFLQAVIPALLMNVYIVGLNQIFDIDIDKVCKWQIRTGCISLMIDYKYVEKWQDIHGYS